MLQQQFTDMKFNLPLIDCFFFELNTVCGRVFHHPEFEEGAKIRSNYCGRVEKWLDESGKLIQVAICSGDEKFVLGRAAGISEIEDFRTGRDEFPKIEREKQRDVVSDLRRKIG